VSPYISPRLPPFRDLPSDGFTEAHSRRISLLFRRCRCVARNSAMILPILVDSSLASSILPFLVSLFRLLNRDLIRGVICGGVVLVNVILWQGRL